MKIFKITILLPVMVLVMSCGSNEPPKCSDDDVESLVKDLLLRAITSRAAEDGMLKLDNGAIETNVEKFKTVLSLKFSEERQRSYDASSKKRFCVAKIEGGYDADKGEQLMRWIGDSNTSKEQQEYQKKLQSSWLAGSVQWRTPQSYSVQYTEKGELYVTLNE